MLAKPDLPPFPARSAARGHSVTTAGEAWEVSLWHDNGSGTGSAERVYW